VLSFSLVAFERRQKNIVPFLRARLMDFCRDTFDVCVLFSKADEAYWISPNELGRQSLCQFSMVNDILMSSVFSPMPILFRDGVKKPI
jgi:hypothetical protein